MSRTGELGTSGSDAPVLIVEDDAEIAVVLRDALEHEGFRVIVAASVAEACARFAPSALAGNGSRAPSLVLLDWNLPDGTGEDVVRAIRPVDASVPIVVMSAAREALAASARVDARERLAKPFDLERLIALVRRYSC